MSRRVATRRPADSGASSTVSANGASMVASFGVEFDAVEPAEGDARAAVSRAPARAAGADTVSVFGVFTEVGQAKSQLSSEIDTLLMESYENYRDEQFNSYMDAYEKLVLAAHARAAVDPSIDQRGYETEMLAAYAQRAPAAAIEQQLEPEAFADDSAYERLVLAEHAKAAVEPSVDQRGYEAEVLATHAEARTRLTAKVRMSHADLYDDLPYDDERSYEQVMLAEHARAAWSDVARFHAVAVWSDENQNGYEAAVLKAHKKSSWRARC